MNQKRNKIIVLIGVIISISIIGVSILRYISSDSFSAEKCAHLLENTINNGLLFSHSQKICQVTKGILIKKVQEIQSNEIVKPGDQIIISVNLPEILTEEFRNSFTGNTIQKPENNIYTLCFVIYPNLRSQSKYLKAETIQSFYQNYFWHIVPDKIMNFSSRGDNYICTKSLSLKNYSKISLIYTIPSQDFLKLGGGNARSYGLEIAFIPKTSLNIPDLLNNISLDIVPANTDEILPIYLYLKPITFE